MAGGIRAMRGAVLAIGLSTVFVATFALGQGSGPRGAETAPGTPPSFQVPAANVPSSPQPQSLDEIISKILKEQSQPKSGKQELPVVIGARIGEEADRTRFVVEMSDPVPIRTFALTNPDRIVIDMPAVEWRLSGPPRPTGFSAVKSYRYGLFRSGNSRFVIDLNQPVTFSNALVLPPEKGYGYRVVIDLFPTTQARFDVNAGWPADLKAREDAAELLASRVPAQPPAHAVEHAARKVIVIDPGHGGVDSGTNAASGLMEKDLVLDVGVRLAHALGRTGAYTVHMTRDSDVFVPLTERVAIARSWHADLFVSLHADSNPDHGVSGLSIYTLSDRGSDREAAALARKENQSDVIAGVDLGGENSEVAPILIDLEQRDTINRSTRFAQAALERLSAATDVLPRDPHRSAAFVVLKAPDVPAVLIELGYLSNAEDAARMSQNQWRDRVADAIAQAIDRQFSMQASLEGGALGR